MFKYESNLQIKAEFKKIAMIQNITQTEIASKCGLIPQELANRFKNKRLALSDLSEWANAMDCDLYIDFVPRNKEN